MMQEERSKEHDDKDKEPMRANGAITNGCNKAAGGEGGGEGGEGGVPAPAKGERAGPTWLLSTINYGGYPRATCSGS
jgi:hypothetical protein